MINSQLYCWLAYQILGIHASSSLIEGQTPILVISSIHAYLYIIRHKHVELYGGLAYILKLIRPKSWDNKFRLNPKLLIVLCGSSLPLLALKPFIIKVGFFFNRATDKENKGLKLLPNKKSKTIEKILIAAHGASDALQSRGYFDYIITLEDMF